MRARQIGSRLMAARRWALVAALAAAAGWTTPSAVAGGTSQGPEWVLDGTDLVALEEVAAAALPQPLEGSYGVEQGGAMLRLSIAVSSADQWIVKRTYEEPGVAVSIKTHTAEQRGSELVSSDGSMTLRGSEAGVLVHEQESGSDSIPPDYWIQYYRDD